MAFALTLQARLSLSPALTGTFTTRQASLDAADRPFASPYRAYDAGLPHQAFPPDTARLLPGLLAATRTGLAPASDDELTTDGQSPNTINLQASGRTMESDRAPA